MTPNDDDDRWMKHALRAAPRPPAVDVTATVQRRVRRNKLARWAGAVAILMTAGAGVWLTSHPAAPPHGDRNRIAAREESPELAVLFAPPPVDALDVIGRQQSAFTEIMRQLAEDRQ